MSSQPGNQQRLVLRPKIDGICAGRGASPCIASASKDMATSSATWHCYVALLLHMVRRRGDALTHLEDLVVARACGQRLLAFAHLRKGSELLLQDFDVPNSWVGGKRLEPA